MNKQLTEAIVRHIMAKFAVIPSSFVNFDKTRPLNDKQFLLNEKVIFEENDLSIDNKVWGCQASVEQNNIIILLSDCTQEIDIPEYAALIQLDNMPAYGIYLVNNKLYDHEAMIAFSQNGKDWSECSTFLQSTFLAGIEQVMSSGLSFKKCTDYKNKFDSLITFIKFHHTIYEL